MVHKYFYFSYRLLWKCKGQKFIKVVWISFQIPRRSLYSLSQNNEINTSLFCYKVLLKSNTLKLLLYLDDVISSPSGDWISHNLATFPSNCCFYRNKCIQLFNNYFSLFTVTILLETFEFEFHFLKTSSINCIHTSLFHVSNFSQNFYVAINIRNKLWVDATDKTRLIYFIVL